MRMCHAGTVLPAKLPSKRFELSLADLMTFDDGVISSEMMYIVS